MTQPGRFHRSLLATASVIAALSLSAWRAEAGPYVQTNLVSDLPGLAKLTEPELVNPWGISHTTTSPASPFWTSNQGTSTANLFAVTGQTSVSKVLPATTNGNIVIPPGGAGAVGPTGQVANTNMSSFPVGNGGNNQFAHFIFANLNGTISAWDTGQTAFIQVTPTAGVTTTYTGLAINTAQTRLYAANDAGTGSINVFDSSFKPVSLGGNAFTDPNLPTGFVPFNVEDIGGKVYVTYAPPGRANQLAATPGMGVVDVFDENGVFQQRLITGSQLAAPWGLALAPAGFGVFGGDLLVANFSTMASEINAFNPTTGAFIGTIPIDPGNGNIPGGLWSLIFGVGGMNGGDPNTLYFTDGIGINGGMPETHGLFAALTPAPEPSSLALLAAAFGLFALRRTRARR
jgi:uncharacterized protein (TIGR03118 family)